MPTLYAPGTTPVAVTPRGFAMLEPGASAALLARIRALLADGRGLGGVIEALTGAYGASITAIPAFAVVLAEGDGVRIAVRGGFAFDVDAAAPERVSGAGVTTWTERVIPAVARVTLTTTELEVSAPAEFEIADGIVLAAGIVWDAAPSGASSAPSPAQPASAAGPAQPAPSGTEDRAGRGDTAGSTAGARRAASPARLSDPSATEAGLGGAGTEVPAPAAPAQASAAPAPTPAAPDPAAGGTTPAAPNQRPNADQAAPAKGAPAPAVPGLIDSSTVQSVADAETLLPVDSALSPHPSSSEPEAAAGRDDASSTSGLDPAWTATVMRAADTVVRPGGAAGDLASGAPAPAPPAGDHDGATISLAQARALREAAARGGAGAAASVPLPADAAAAPLAPPRSPAPGRIRVSTGQVLPLDRTVVIGRRPRSTRVSGTDLPHLVAVDSPQQDISRSHVELRVEGESIVATDLRTTNGTTLLRAGADPVRLHPGEGTVVVPGDVLDLGDGITVAIEGLS
ncbi:FHA domain-containing protein [Microbacterium hibisci]|uniref:FHA domain-containing protein n=1 Tax=Microbacterium hibisci TaxID=2036000 RepID=UPI001941FDCD|nr:FHA domain-containing protein [Microbacterium hibisci]